MNVRSVSHIDLEKIRELNESALPHVNSIPISEFQEFITISSFFLVAEEEGQLAGFLIVLGPGQSYVSENYQYFSEHYSSFDYVDRIVIGEAFRGKGLGSQLYKYLFKESQEACITCEVNIKPPNPKSIQFHQMLGFEEVERQYSEEGKKYVSLMVKKL
ncbi:MAG: GNAT family N-acetyltransferase [Balneolaceae bacterium]|nr:GNAT family N-acetyltransferase [Balneolaceae bacterium]MBO6546712.1 GNAT family N-acetyltransferase [Balneolaceae bacterium]MBO6649070.1 GNAT family N-acetyltransferase [Balneolaceae bacterium]